MMHRSVGLCRGNPSGIRHLAAQGAAARWLLLLLPLLAVLLRAGPAAAQERDLTIVQGKSTVLVVPNLQRLSVGDAEIAEAVAVSPREILINARRVGTTSLVVWDAGGTRILYNVHVTAELSAIQQQLQTLFPGERVSVSSAGAVILLYGRVSNAAVARQMVDVAKATGATVLDNLQVTTSRQIVLQVRFAEVTRNALSALSTDLSAVGLDKLDRIVNWAAETVSDGTLNILLSNDEASLEALIRALKTKSLLKSLAEPNLVAMDGQPASFLAGGEFPYPVVQPSQGLNAITIQFREFGIRLNFTPTITGGGTIRLHVEPEVSSLDFANGLTISGFSIPTILTRRARTDIELREGQTFAIAGLMDNSVTDNITKIPVLGDLPILGAFFRSKDARQHRSELLVLVTPRLVSGTDTPPPLPGGEPQDWKWDRFLGRPGAVPGAPPGQR